MCKARRVPPAASTERRPLRVAVDATPLLGARTGVAEFCLGALGALGRRHDLRLSAFAVTWRRRRLLQPLVPDGVRVVQRAMPARPLHAAWQHLRVPPAEWFVGPADVVHGTNYVVPPTRRAARVVTVHDLTVVRFPELCDRATLVFPSLVRKAVAEGAWVHTPSRFVAEEVVAELGVDPDRVRAVHHGVPAHRVAAALGPEDASPPGMALPDGVTRYVLAVGTVEPRKDLPGLVRAFDLLAGEHGDVGLVIAGGDGWGAGALTEVLSRARWRHRVLRTGYVDDRRLQLLVEQAAVLAFPSVYEGFGLPPLEAMAAGVPVVATSVGAVPEVVGDGGLLVPAGDAEALADALGRVLDDGDLRAALVDRGRARAATFTWEACATGLADLYRDAARSSSSRSGVAG